MDPLCEKYYGVSPYAYCANNPVNLVDPEGEKIVIKKNIENAIEDLSKIAATRRGAAILSKIINNPRGFVLSPTVLRGDAGFDGKEIQYLKNPLLPVDLSFPSEFVYMGHEISHVNDFVEGTLHYDRNGHSIEPVSQTETRAVTFENYLRTVYRIPFLRRFYHNLNVSPVTSRVSKDRVKDFTKLNQRGDGRAFGYSFVSYRKGKDDSETKRYMVSGIDENNEFYYQFYETEEDYQKAISDW